MPTVRNLLGLAMETTQLQLEFDDPQSPRLSSDYRVRLEQLLSFDLGFHDASSRYASHSFHAFPAKFPPQLPRLFIRSLTEPGEVVLDPMSGSGTTVVEAVLAGRHGVGVDIDPMAVAIGRVKTEPTSVSELRRAGYSVLTRASEWVESRSDELRRDMASRMDAATQRFVDYWFTPNAQTELWALSTLIDQVQEDGIRRFLRLVLSATIITKSGGVSLAMDLAHTRPHRVMDKRPRSALLEFRRRLERNLNGLSEVAQASGSSRLVFGDAQRMPLRAECVDLVVTSPPYASNAIDYMRAHKFSLVWFGHSVGELSTLRGRYIGGESVTQFQFEPMPAATQAVIDTVAIADPVKGRVLQRYYSEMTRTLREIHRVLRPGKGAVLVVGSSRMRGIDTRTHDCLAEIAGEMGFAVAGIGRRKLDRNRRMMPARAAANSDAGIEARMHYEYVIGLVK